MSTSNKFLFVLMMLAIIPAAVFMMSKTAAATTWPKEESLELVKAARTSGSTRYPELVRLRDEISKAGSVNEARVLALAPTNGAIGALKNARSIMPFSEDLRLAETRLSDARSRIEDAGMPRQVADEFSGMMLAGLDDDRAANVNVGKAGCSYSTGEVIAIVVGLILGIIPGLILLVVLC
ncbi:conserved exported hypothetical protein [Candidatus Methylobacter favarea]|uniref:Uncharacterized protein n=1 Tax=Candidatus Methylobacter favarea TaxID=2707345 RepID=A0A8S0XF20_9GAMM|nr:hypothetical protein [Candidatus Methylobacter favarea]CAA9890224.1 conserved exported hypothetical protein [Candidatus Methylobacter favarea]